MVLACMAAGLSAPWSPDPNWRPDGGFSDPRFGDPELDEIRYDVEDGLRRHPYGYDIDQEMGFLRRQSPIIDSGWDQPTIFDQRLPYRSAPAPMMSGYPEIMSVDPRAQYDEQARFAAQAKAQRKADKEGQRYAAEVLRANNEEVKYRLLQSQTETAIRAQAEAAKERERQAREQTELLAAEVEALRRERSIAFRRSVDALEAISGKEDADAQAALLDSASQTRNALRAAAAKGEELTKIIKLQNRQKELLEEQIELQKRKKADLKERLAALRAKTAALEDGDTDASSKTSSTDTSPVRPVASPAEPVVEPVVKPVATKPVVAVVATDTDAAKRTNPALSEVEAATTIQRVVRERQKTQQQTRLQQAQQQDKTVEAGVKLSRVLSVAKANNVLQQVRDLYDNEDLSDEDLRHELTKLFVHDDPAADGTTRRSPANIGLMYSYIRTFENLQHKAQKALAGLNDTNDPDGSQREDLRQAQARYRVAQDVLEVRQNQEAQDAKVRLQKVEADLKELKGSDWSKPVRVVDKLTGKLKPPQITKAQALEYKRQAVANEKARLKGKWVRKGTSVADAGDPSDTRLAIAGSPAKQLSVTKDDETASHRSDGSGSDTTQATSGEDTERTSTSSRSVRLDDVDAELPQSTLALRVKTAPTSATSAHHRAMSGTVVAVMPGADSGKSSSGHLASRPASRISRTPRQ